MASRFPRRRRPSANAQDTDQGSSPRNEDHARSIGRSIPQVTSTTSSPNLSSSLTHRAPARSFSHHNWQSFNDPAHYSSEGVREETAQLASWALKETNSIRSRTSPRQSISLGVGSFPHKDIKDHFEVENDNTLAQDLSHLSLPDVIEETSESVSPALPLRSPSATPPQPPNTSLLADMLRRYPSKSPSKINGAVTPQTYFDNGASNGSDPTADNTDDRPGERSLLLPKRKHSNPYITMSYSGTRDIESQFLRPKKQNKLQQLMAYGRQSSLKWLRTAINPKKWSRKAVWEQGIKQPIELLPCVFLGLLLNVLDALSYGMILFPLGEPIFANTGPDGISMFYISCIVSQLVFSLGGSIFKGAVGSEMIEVVPFFHKMTYTIMTRTRNSDPKIVLATVITSYAMSSVLTGIVFFCLGAFKLGRLVNFFPRHILIGCIGGVGFFLFVTGIEVSARLDGNFVYNLATLKHLFQSDTVALWTTPLLLAIVLMILKRFSQSAYVVPMFFVAIAGIFYILVTAISSLNLANLRVQGWIFPQIGVGVPFYHFYSYYDFHAVDWRALSSTIPAMFALTFFGTLHVPINVPALAIAAEEDDLNLNREFVAHGLSNALSGMFGSIQNYLVYVNSEMFIHNGGNNRLAGILLAAATFGVLVAGPGMIGYVPIMVVGALIFYLGISLLEEALWDPWGKTNRLEYLTIVAIVLIMGTYDFVAGILAGIVLACLNFVVQTSRKSAIRASYSGEVLESTVRRHPVQRHFLHKVGYQIYVTKLAGYLFFGSIVQVEKKSRALIEEEAFRKQPIRYLIFDLAHVNGVDYSAAEAFTRIERILGRRDVRMIISGIKMDDEVGKSLRNVELWKENSSVEFFENLNGALESCENELLKAYYQQRDAQEEYGSPQIPQELSKAETTASSTTSVISPFGTDLSTSPRQSHLQQAATTTLDTQPAEEPRKWQSFKQPLRILLNTFQDLSDEGEEFWSRAVPFFERRQYSAGTVLFTRGDTAEAFYLLQTGLLRATYHLPTGHYQESIVAGTTCGELPFFSSTPRTATVAAEMDSVAWRLDQEGWDKMQRDWPEGSRELLKVALRLTKERVDAVVGYVLTTAG